MATGSTSVKKIFYCYAREDKILRDELEQHLGALKKSGQVTTWHDREILPGTEWAHEIDAHLNTADIILLLVSPDFIASDYCYGVEMLRALERHTAGEAHVIPIIVRPVDWEETPIGNLQILPEGKKPITLWPDHDEAFYEVVREIRALVKRLQKTRDQWIEEGNAYWEAGRGREALAAYEQAFSFKPDSTDAFYEAVLQERRGWLLKWLSRNEEAVVAYDNAIRLYPTAYTYWLKGNALRDLKQNRKALEAYEQAIRCDPINEKYYSCKGDILKRLGRLEEAEQAYKKAKRLEEGKFDDD